MSIQEAYTTLSLSEVCFLEECWRAVCIPTNILGSMEHMLPVDVCTRLFACVRALRLAESTDTIIQILVDEIYAIREASSGEFDSVLQYPESQLEFKTKLRTLIEFSQTYGSVFEVCFQGEEFGTGVKLLSVPPLADGAFTEIEFSWKSPLIYEDKDLDAYFDGDYKASQHPLAKRLWDRGSTITEKEIFLGIPGLFNHACNRCASLSLSLERDDRDNTGGGSLYIYFQAWIHSLVIRKQDFNLSNENLMATWEYHYRQTELVFDRCSVCKAPLSVVGIAETNNAVQAFEYLREILREPQLTELMETVYLKQLQQIAQGPLPEFGLAVGPTNLDLMCKCIPIFRNYCILNDLLSTNLRSLPVVNLEYDLDDLESDNFDSTMRGLICIIMDATGLECEDEKQMWRLDLTRLGSRIVLSEVPKNMRNQLFGWFTAFFDTLDPQLYYTAEEKDFDELVLPGKLVCALQLLELTADNPQEVAPLWQQARLSICALAHKLTIDALESPVQDSCKELYALHLWWLLLSYYLVCRTGPTIFL